eukprot:CAMPEP_0178442968 /NCGR_PEP_ID=MMETSP0689_2-20121128/38533_1 /TAXON_ID=160604 /ORGANISM="Amphidinium massartii, Strain CS-259" /LENGTH=132 /DNA_ID=CAMNT_0020066721 /DNA_START=27 /DNA_END=425 /DNA_ORIENTATION=+
MSARPKPGGKATSSDASGKDRGKGKVQQKEEDGEFLNVPALQHNLRTLGHARVIAGIVAGCVAGLLKFEGLAGLFVFVFITALHSCMLFVKMGFQVARHFPHMHDVFTNQFSHGLMSFILFWTLSYDIVHIF